MSGDIDTLIAGLHRFREVALDGAARGLDLECPEIQAELQATTAHGDQTGATRAAYAAWRVGRGETGSAALAASVSAGEALNPGQTETSTVEIDTELGVIISDPMEYGPDRETRNAGEKASIGPMVGVFGISLTAAAALGSKQALGG